MPIKVECNRCGAKYRVGDHRAGQDIPCKECGADIPVPGRRRTSDDETIPLRRRSAGAVPRRQPAGGGENGDDRTKVWIAAGVGSAVAVVVLVAAILILSGDDHDQPSGGDNAVAQNDAAHRAASNGLGAPPGSRSSATAGGGGSPLPPRATSRPSASRGAAPAGNGRPFGGDAAANSAFGNALPEEGRPFDGGAPGDARPTRWSVDVDPPAQPVSIDPMRKIEVELPPRASATDVVFPDGYSSIVGVGKIDQNSAMEVWDLGSRTRIGRVGGVGLFVPKTALSIDGLYFAATTFGGENSIYVWDVKASKGLIQIPIAKDLHFDWLKMAGSRRLLLGGRSGGDRTVSVWTLPDGKPERQILPAGDTSADGVACSPGGRYLALFARESDEYFIRLYDLSTGGIAGESRAPAPDFGWTTCSNLAFSPDGAELAGLFDAGRTAALWVWNVADGHVAERISFEKTVRDMFPQENGRRLQWFPNERRWLVYGNGVIDRGSKNVIFQFPENRSDRAPRQILDDQRIAVVTAKGVTTYELSEEVLSQAQAIIAQGGEAADAGLPPLTRADRSGVRQVQAAGGGTEWLAQPDPVPAASGALLPQPVQVGASDAKLNGFWLSSPAAAKAALFYVNENSRLSSRGSRSRATADSEDDSPFRIELLDLAAGKRETNFGLPFRSKLLAMSPSGTRAVCAVDKTEDRLDVWSIADEQHVVGLRPYQEKDNDRNKKITAAVFVDDEHLLTLNPENELLLWDLPKTRAVYQIDQAVEHFSSNPGISPGGKWLVVFTKNACSFFDALTGQPQGSLAFDGTAAAAAFHHDGSRLAIVARNGNDNRLISWNLKSGERDLEFPLPQRSWHSEGMHFCGDRHVYVQERAEGVLIDLDARMVVWTYRNPPFGINFPISPDGRHWLLGPPRLGSREIYLAAISLPGQHEQTRLGGQVLSPQFVVQPGSQVSLQVRLPQQAPGHTNFPAAVQQSLSERFGKHGISVVAGAPVQVQVSLTESSSGKTLEFRQIGGFGGGGGDMTVPEKIFSCKVVITYQGRTVWETGSSISNNAFMTHIPQGTSLEKHLSDQQWRSAVAYFSSFEPPSHIFAEGAEKGLGASTLTPAGPVAGP